MMNDKVIRLTKALWHESVKRIPYVLLLLLILIFAQMLQNTQIVRRNSADTKNLLSRVATLSQDNKTLSTENHQLSQQNVQLSSQNAQHVDCLAQLFAHYTQTLKPIQTIDLQACVISQGGATSATNGASSQNGFRQSLTSPETDSLSSPQSTLSTPPAQRQSSQLPVTNQSLLDQLIQPIKNLINGLQGVQ